MNDDDDDDDDDDGVLCLQEMSLFQNISVPIST